jgi:beta-exotoxin I transport system permease protein
VNGLLGKTLRDQQRALLGWGIGIAGIAVMYSAFYPSVVKSAGSLNKYLESLPEALKTLLGGDYTSPAGYLRAETFTTLGPILFLVFAIGAGARAVAGEEETGTLDLLLSTPIRRRHVVTDKLIAMLLTTAALALILWTTLLLVGPPFDLHVAVIDVLAACLMLFLLAAAFGTVALAIGCATGHRSVAIGVTGGLATAAFIVDTLAPTVTWLQRLRPLSPFRWYFDPDPLVQGIDAKNAAVLVAIVAVASVVAHLAFERRDLAA